MADVLIRDARVGDGEGMTTCWLDFGRYYATISPEHFRVPDVDGQAAEFNAAAARRIHQADADKCMLVAETNGRVVGFIGARIAQPMDTARRQGMRESSQVRVEITVLAVAEAYRRQGIGTRLMAAAEKWARGRGAVLATVDTYVGSYLSVPFYLNRMRYDIQSLRFLKRLGQPLSPVSPSTDVDIREERIGDGEGMAHCWLDMWQYYAALNPELFRIPQAEGLPEWFESRIAARARAADSDGHWLVAEADGQIVGFLGASVAKPWRDAHREVMRELSHARLTINVLAVAEAYRRRGIGTRLMEVAEEWARGRGAVLATTDTYVGSHFSVPFYRNRMHYSIQSLQFRKRLN